VAQDFQLHPELNVCEASRAATHTKWHSNLIHSSSSSIMLPQDRLAVQHKLNRDLSGEAQRSALGYWFNIAITATPIATTVTMAPTGPP
jgi:hypothetical protein